MNINKKIFLCLGYALHLGASLSFEAHFQQAHEFFLNNNYEAAIAAYSRTIELNPHCHQAYFNRGLVYASQNNHQQAIESYVKAFDLCPTYVKALVQAGNSYQELKHYESAIEMYKKGLAIDRNSCECLVGLGRTLNTMSNFEDSITYLRTALQLKSYDTTIMLELANTLNMAQHTHQALELYQHILASLPHNISILYNIAYTLKKLNRINEALPIYKKVLTLDPHHVEAHFSLALAYLAAGNFEQGWAEYEWRWKREHQSGPRILSRPLWDGSSLDTKTILLHAEQGLGDTLQFIRYAQLLKAMYNVKIIVASQDPLIPLMRLCPYIDRVVSLYEKIPPYDVHAPLLSMPYLMKTRLDSIPHIIPYLYADETLVQLWKEKLRHNPLLRPSSCAKPLASSLEKAGVTQEKELEEPAFKIGICWQGNSNYSTHFLRTAVAAKSVPLTRFMPLLTLKNIMVYNLQKTTGEDQCKNLDSCPSFISFDTDFDESHGRFMDTAAVIKNLDLIITVDTSIAHLAGGLGIPTWVLLPEPADWRWMIERTDTPWYPTMRLFRQPISGDWDSVIHTIINELKKLLEQ